jgi:hypothetical protein
MAYQPKTGAPCSCRKGQHRDNCPQCEGTGWVIDFRKIREAVAESMKKGNEVDHVC